MKEAVMVRAIDLLDAVGLAITEDTAELRLVIRDGVFFIQSFTNRGELLDESGKFEVLGNSEGADGVYRYPLFLFEQILKAVMRDLEAYDREIVGLVFDFEENRTEVMTTEGRLKIYHLYKID